MKHPTKKLSRRAFGRLVVAAPAAAAPQALSRDEELRAANERRRSNAQSLSKVDLPMSTEPASVFRP